MNDNEIIKALGNERFLAYGGHGCVRCKYRYHTGDERCGVKGCKIARAALDLINRQKAEIERYLHSIKLLEKDVLDVQSELKEYKAMCICKIAEMAVKEFAERLKAYVDVGHLRPPTEKCFSELDVANMLDNLLAEMESERK